MPRLDPTAVQQELQALRPFPQCPEEGERYLAEAVPRFLRTFELLPAAGPGQRLLELGAAPYYFTHLLRRHSGYDLKLANYYGDNWPAECEDVLTGPDGREQRFRFRNFNAERDPFPYADGVFDVVLCCEILEHLTADPTHMLAEIHRVLRPQGLLLLTTPNVFNLAYSLRLLRGLGNIFHPYSGHGIYARHQREYSLTEVVDLLQGIGYTIVQAVSADIHSYPWHWRLLKGWRPLWRDHLLVLARQTGVRQAYRPDWLYQAQYVRNASR